MKPFYNVLASPLDKPEVTGLSGGEAQTLQNGAVYRPTRFWAGLIGLPLTPTMKVSLKRIYISRQHASARKQIKTSVPKWAHEGSVKTGPLTFEVRESPPHLLGPSMFTNTTIWGRRSWNRLPQIVCKNLRRNP
jgi:hypothetical protein